MVLVQDSRMRSIIQRLSNWVHIRHPCTATHSLNVPILANMFLLRRFERQLLHQTGQGPLQTAYLNWDVIPKTVGLDVLWSLSVSQRNLWPVVVLHPVVFQLLIIGSLVLFAHNRQVVRGQRRRCWWWWIERMLERMVACTPIAHQLPQASAASLAKMKWTSYLNGNAHQFVAVGQLFWWLGL